MKLFEIIKAIEQKEQCTIDKESIELGVVSLSIIAEHSHKPGKFVLHLYKRDFTNEYDYSLNGQIIGTITERDYTYQIT